MALPILFVFNVGLASANEPSNPNIDYLQNRNLPAASTMHPLVFSTFLTGEGDGKVFFSDIATDHLGRTILMGGTNSTSLPVSQGAAQSSLGGNWDAVIAILGSDGSSLEYLSYLGGSENDTGRAIWTDGLGSIYIIGDTLSSDFPTTEGAYRRTAQGYEMFVTKLDADGTSLAYSTLLGGSGNEYGIDIAVDGEGRAFVLGDTNSTDLPTAPTTYVPTTMKDVAFVVRLDANGSSLDYCRYIQWTNADLPSPPWTRYCRIALDELSRAYVLGTYHSEYCSITSLGFLLRIDEVGRYVRTIYSLSWDGYGAWEDVAIISNRYIYIVGTVSTTELPLTHAPLAPVMSVSSRIGHQISHTPFVCKLDSAPSTSTKVVYMSLLGGSGYGWGRHIEVDEDGCAFISGTTSAVDFPVSYCAFQRVRAGGHSNSDAYLCKLSPDGSHVVYSTFLGGTDEESLYQFVLGHDQDAFVFGMTESTDFPLTPGAYCSVFTSGSTWMRFLTRLSSEHLNPPMADAGENMTIDQHEMVVLNGFRSLDDKGIVNWTWTIDLPGGTRTLYGPMPAPKFDEAGAFNVTLNVTDADGNWDIDCCVVTVRDTTPPTPLAPDVSVPEGEAAVLNGSASYDNVGIVNWTWTTGHPGGWVYLYGPIVNYTFEGIGKHLVSLRVTDLAGNNAVLPLNGTVTDVTPPVARAGPDRQVDQHDVLALNDWASTDNVGIVQWRWEFTYDGQIVVLDRSHPSFRFDTAGVYDLQLTVWDVAGNVGADAMVLTVRDTTPPIADAGPDQKVPQHSVVTFDGAGSTDNLAILGWTWSFNYDSTDKEFRTPTPTFRFDLVGTYVVRLTVRDAEGYASWDLMEISVIDIEPPVAVAGGNITIEWGSTVIFDGTGSWDNVGVQNLTWSFAYGKVTRYLHGWTRDFTFSREGNYTIILTVADAAGNTDSTTMRVDVRPKPSSEEPQETWWLWPSIIALILVVMTVMRMLQLYKVSERKR